MNAKCPKCNANVSIIKIETLPAYNLSGKQFHGAVFLCPECSAVLGAGLDPAAVGEDLVDRVVARVARLLKQ